MTKYTGQCSRCGGRRYWAPDKNSTFDQNYTTCWCKPHAGVWADAWVELDDNGNVIAEFGRNWTLELLKEKIKGGKV